MVTTTTDPGTISVPMSSILDALEGVLTDDERTALYKQLIGLTPSGVAPGDLITAELFNAVLTNINDLQMRVAVLEGSSDQVPHVPVITQIVPQLVRTGDPFTVIGENLNPSLLGRIDVNNTNIPLDRIKAGSSSTRLMLDAPGVIGLPPNGATVILAVSNPAGTAQGSYVQLPGVASDIQANIAYPLKSVTPNEPFKASTAYDFTFEIAIQSSNDETFNLVPQLTAGAGWSAVVKGAGNDKIPVTAASAANPLKVTRVITVTTGASGSGSLLLNLKGTSFPNYSNSSQPTAITLAAPPQIPSDKINVVSVTPIGTLERKFASNTLSIRRSPANGTPGTTTLTILVKYAVAGTYQISTPSATPQSDWTVSRTTSASVTTGSPDTTVAISINVTPKNNGTQYIAGPGQFSFTIVSNDGTQQLPFSAQLQIVDVLPQ